ncbi:MAG: hypothetical protein AB1894_20900 [Chloroflexota bacterium]
MNEHPLTRILNRLAEEGVPADLDLRFAIYRRLEMSKTQPQRGVFPMKTSFAQPRRFAVGILLTVLFLAVALLATPQGRAWAQNALRFFSQASSDVRLVPTLSATLGAIPTDDATALSQVMASSTTDILPFQDTCGSRYSARCSMIQIREMVTFPVSELTELPKGWEFLGATGGPELVRAYYQSETGMLELSQEPDGSPALNTWSVGADAVVESVVVGGVPGEYVQGAWIDPGENAGAVAWDASIPERILRWEVQGIRFTLRFIPAKSDKGIRPDKAMMVAFAARVALEPDKEVVPISTPHAAIDDVSVEAGFLVDEPGWLPERYVFETAKYVPENNLVCLFYGYPDSESIANLVIVESPWLFTLQNILMPPQYYNGAQIDIPVYTETLTVGGAQDGRALYASNGLDVNPLCGMQGITSNHVLLWQSGEKSFIISGALGAFDGRQFITRLEMQRMAESLTGVSTISAQAFDPEYLPSAEAAEALAGFDIKTPSQMPAGARFAYAVYRETNGAPEVVLVYFSATRDSIERRHSYLFFQNVVPPNTLDEMALGGGEWVSVHGQPAVYSQVCWDDTVNGGDSGCNMSLSWVNLNGIRFDLEVYLPGALDKAILVVIAESMQ